MIYFITDGDKIKIGYTKNDPQKRLNELQTGNSRKLKLLAVIPSEKDIERTLHKRFSGNRAIGEWFNPSVELIALISTLSKTFDEVITQDEISILSLASSAILENGNRIKELEKARKLEAEQLKYIGKVELLEKLLADKDDKIESLKHELAIARERERLATEYINKHEDAKQKEQWKKLSDEERTTLLSRILE